MRYQNALIKSSERNYTKKEKVKILENWKFDGMN